MKVYNVIYLLFMLFNLSTIAQTKPSINYNSESGNYIIQFQGYTNKVYELTFEPSTKIEPSIYTKVLNEDSVFIYNYIVKNSSNSIQRLQDFDLEIYSSIEKITQPDDFWKNSRYSFIPVFGWYNSKDPSGLNHPLNGIAPDSSLSGFSFHSKGLPSIVKTYSKGKPKTHLAFPEEPPENVEDLLRPLTKFPNNSVVKLSVGPRDRSNLEIHEEFLDTLTYFTTESYDLGWIKDEQTKTKYEKYFFDSKDALVNLDTSSARTYLENVLTDVDIDSSSALSSEAYALLRYNTEYLLEQLPIAEGMRIASISPQITIEKTKDFTLTVHGTDFTKKSEIYWDGKKKKTKFISESVLEAKIKKKDVKKEGVYKVHITEKKIGETEELEFNVYKKLPEKLMPVVNCVEELDKNKFRVWFGYENYNDGIVLLNGKENEIKGGKKKRDKPPVIFLPGVHEKVFSVEYDKKKKLTWELVKEKAEVHKDSPKCD